MWIGNSVAIAVADMSVVIDVLDITIYSSGVSSIEQIDWPPLKFAVWGHTHLVDKTLH